MNPAVMPAHAMPGMAATIPMAPAPPAPEASSLPANNTVYINNLNSKIKRDDLKKSLYAVFVQFGQIMDIITGKCLKMRGQAFVIFAELSSATNALRTMQGFPLYEKPMRIQYAKVDSDIISKQKGTFVQRPQKKRPKKVKKDEGMSAAALAALESQAGQGGQSARAIRRRMQREAAAITATGGTNDTAVPPPDSLNNGQSTNSTAYPPGQPPRTYPAGYNGAPPPPGTYPASGQPNAGAAPMANPAQMPDQPPNKILFVTNLPQDADEAMLGVLFTQFGGFREVRMVPGRSDIAFVEFGNETEAGIAKHGLQGFNVRPGNHIRITFAKK